MPTIVNCPSCNRKLRVPDDLLGRTVKCPSCGTSFTAGGEDAAAPPGPPQPPTEEAPKWQAVDDEPLPPSGVTSRRRSLQPEDEYEPEHPGEEYDEEPRRRRRRRRNRGTPHRGTLVLVLGILSIVICGWLGPFPWIMGNRDLEEMRNGIMDPEGEGLTNAGRICGIIGTVLGVLQCCYLAVVGVAVLMPLIQKGGR